MNGPVRSNGSARYSAEGVGRDRAPRTATADLVLLVDSDVQFKETLTEGLDRLGIGVSWRGRILGLFDALADLDPIALVMSAELAGSDPLDLIRSVRRSRWSELPIFVLTGTLDRSFELRAHVEGADAVLKRDGSTGALAARILGHAQRRARRRQVAARDLADVALQLCDQHANRSIPSGPPIPQGQGNEAGPPPAMAWQPPAAVPQPPPPAQQTYLDMSQADGNGVQSPPARVDPGLPLPALADSRLREASVPDVILVDDDPSLLEMLRYAMTNRGYRTLSLPNGLDALRTLCELNTAGRRPVVLLDVDLPGLDGFRILHELNGCRPGDYQVILCTVHSSEATQVLGIQSGAVDYIVKPFRMPIVLAKVDRLLGSSQLQTGR